MAEKTIGALIADAAPGLLDLVEIEQSDASASNKSTIQNLSKGIDHGLMTGLGDDDHVIYALLAGRAGGQIVRGGTAASENLTLQSTAHATKGNVVIASSTTFIVDEVNGRVGVGIAVPLGPFHVAGASETFGGFAGSHVIRIGDNIPDNYGAFGRAYLGGQSGVFIIRPHQASPGQLAVYNDVNISGVSDLVFSGSPHVAATGYTIFEAYDALGCVISSVSFTSGRGEIRLAPNRVEKARITPEGNFGLGVTAAGANATFTECIGNGVVPTTSPADAFQMYSADVIAGNAAPHFRTENGAVIKLHQRLKADHGNWATLADVVAALVATGLFDQS